jgi:hypothetical protein
MKPISSRFLQFFIFWAAVADCVGADAPPYFLAPGTKAMAQRLEKLATEVNPGNSVFFSADRVAIYGPQVKAIQDPVQMLRLLPGLAQDMLNAGQTQDAIDAFASVESLSLRFDTNFLAQNKRIIRRYQAVAQMRLGEQENCLTNHTIDSCLLPIRGGGVHQNQRGSRAAIKILTESLSEFPEDRSFRWLLNVACMTVGEYPDKVPSAWVIPPKVFESDFQIKRFLDVAGVAGLDVNELSGGSIAEDFDGDGLLDIMVSSVAVRAPMHLFRNNGDGTFTDRTKEAGLTGEVGGLNMVHTDYNNDGFPDVLVLRGGWFQTEGHHPVSLLRNNGDGTFSDVTEEAGLLRFHPTQTAAWFDFNNDGWIDLFIGNESVGQDVNPCELFRNNGDGTFTECAAAAGIANVGFVKGVAAGDYNNDGLPDLYLSRRMEPNVLYRNDGPKDPKQGPRSDWKFSDVSVLAGVTEPIRSFPTWFWDFDNDGWLDIFVAGYFINNVGDVAADYLGLPHTAERARLYRNNRDGTFTDVTRAVGLFKVLHAMGSNFGDLDNDGWLDFYLGTGDPDLGTLIPNRMFRNAEGKLFQDVTTSGGFGHLQKGHGVSFADFDNDGDQDVHEDMGGAFAGDLARNVLYENPGNQNHWIKLKLEGTKSNRAAIGARIKLTARRSTESREIHRVVGTGGSFGGNPLRQEIGLGEATSLPVIEVFWPASGKTQTFKDVQMDRCYRIVEGKVGLEELKMKTFKFADPTGAMHHHHHE